MKTTHSQRGLTLIEVLVALLVMSVGLLGIAALQLGSLQQNTSAYWTSQGVWLAYDMADRMRANTIGVGQAAYSGIVVDGTETVVDCSSGCAPGTLAQYDAYLWGQKITTLPAGEGHIDDNGDGTFTVSVMWDEQGGAVGTGCDPSNPDDKICAQVTIRP